MSMLTQLKSRHARVRRVSKGYAAALLMAGLLLSGCAAASTTSAPSQSGRTTLTIGWAQIPDNLDPAITGSQTVYSLDVQVFQTLLWETPSGKLTPDLATSWTSSPSDTLYTFTLRKGVYFQDGTPFNAQAVVANLNFITNKKTQSVSAIAALGSCTSASVLSTYKVQVSCTAPDPAFLQYASQPELGMQSPTSISKYGSDIQFHMSGTGPFEVVSYTPNVSIVMQRYARFDWAPPALHENGPAKVDKLVFDLVPNDGSRISELESGQAQLIEQTPTAYYVKLAHSSAYRNVAVPISGMGIWMPFNTGRFPTNSTAVRQAISYLINKPAANKTALQGASPVLNTPLQPGMPGYDSHLPTYAYDPSKAASILRANGWTKSGGTWSKGGKPLSIVLAALSTDPQYPLILEAVQSQLSQAGIVATIVTDPVTPWISLLAAGNYNLTVLEYAAPDPSMLSQFFVPGDYYDTWTKVNVPTLTHVLNAAQAEPVASTRDRLYAQAQEIIMNDALEIPFHVNQDLLTMSSKVTGVSYEGGGDDFFYGAQVKS